jgi:WD40 repeat protein
MQRFDVQKVSSLKGHRDSVFAIDIYKEPHLIFSAGADGIVALWDISQDDIGKIIAKIPASVYSIRYLPEENDLLVAQNFDGLHLIDLDHNQEKASVQLTKSYIFDVQVSGDLIFIAEGQGRVLMLRRSDLKVLHYWDETDKSARSLSIHDNRLSVGYSDNSIRVFDLVTLKKTGEWRAHENSVFKVIHGPDGVLMSASRDAHLKFWNHDGEEIESIVAHMYAINDICFSPDSLLFATCSMDKSIKLWDYKKRKLLKVIDKARHAGHGTSVNKLLWTTFNNYIVSCSDDRTLSVWDINQSEK